MVNTGIVRAQVQKELQAAGIAPETARFESRILLEQILETPKSSRISLSAPLTPLQSERLNALVRRRCAGEPLQYLCGSWEFYGLEFFVGNGVLIPRQDTETLVETVLYLRKGKAATKLLDLCSGSGCIPVAIFCHLPGVTGVCAEYSPDALLYLRRNLQRHKVKMEIAADDVRCPSASLRCRRFDVITCNPPYLSKQDMQHLQREVQFEPEIALYGGEDGLDFYRTLIPLWKSCLEPDGWMVFEVGAGQAQAVRMLLEQNGLQESRVIRDDTGTERVAAARRHG